MAAPTSFKGLTASTETFDGSPLRVAIVHARWNTEVITPLVNGALEELHKAGVKEENIVIESVPGSYELPWACSRLIAASQVQASASATDLLGASSLLDPIQSLTSSVSSPDSKRDSIGGGKRLKGPFSAVIAIGTLIKGSTMHFEYICDAVSQNLMRVSLDTGVPVIFGVLTCLTEDQALERAGVDKAGKGHNHGLDWGKAAVEMGVKGGRWAEGKI